MDYQKYLSRVMTFDFIPDYASADAAVKATLGLLASELDEPAARELTKNLPEPLTLERLRGHQKKTSENISFAEYIQEIGAQFHLSMPQTSELVDTVLQITKEAIDDRVRSEILHKLPQDWSRTVSKSWQ